MKSWFITGASSGIGLEIARLALARGDMVVATAQRKTGLIKALGGQRPNLLALRLDATDGPGASAAIATGIARFGAIDMLVNSTDLDSMGTIGEVADLEYVFQYSVLGLLTVIRAALPHMSRRGSGHVLNICMTDSRCSEHAGNIHKSVGFAIDEISASLRAESMLRGIQLTAVNYDYNLLNSDDICPLQSQIDRVAASGTAPLRVNPPIGPDRHRPDSHEKMARCLMALANTPIRLTLFGARHPSSADAETSQNPSAPGSV